MNTLNSEKIFFKGLRSNKDFFKPAKTEIIHYQQICAIRWVKGRSSGRRNMMTVMDLQKEMKNFGNS